MNDGVLQNSSVERLADSWMGFELIERRKETPARLDQNVFNVIL